MMDGPDLELGGSIRAARLLSRTSPDTATETENVRLERRERRLGVPPHVQPNATYNNVKIEKRIWADLDHP